MVDWRFLILYLKAHVAVAFANLKAATGFALGLGWHRGHGMQRATAEYNIMHLVYRYMVQVSVAYYIFVCLARQTKGTTCM